MADLCSLGDVEAILQFEPPAVTPRLIELATGLIEGTTGREWDQGDAPAGLIAICARVVARTVSNPAQQNSQVAGPFQSSWEPGSTLRLTDRDIVDINRELGVGTVAGSKVGSTRTGKIWR